jgi:glycosyltransferase involved in cell wall biosynthesis
MNPAINIVLPCYNPNDSWYLELLAFYASAKDVYDLQFILVNDGSGPNRLPQQLEHLKQQGISVLYIAYDKNRGKGYALRQGILAAERPFIIYTDVDFPFTEQSTLSVIGTLISGTCDVVAGYRDQSYYMKRMPFYRRLLSKFFRFFIKHMLGLPVTDTQCGLKGFNQKGKTVFLRTTINRYLFDFEFIHMVIKDKTLAIQTVRVELKENIVFSRMRLKIFVQELFNLAYVLLFKKTQRG